MPYGHPGSKALILTCQRISFCILSFILESKPLSKVDVIKFHNFGRGHREHRIHAFSLSLTGVLEKKRIFGD